MVITTGNQLRAARALAGIGQYALARSAGLNVNTISAMEKRGRHLLTSSLPTVKAITDSLDALGVECTDGCGVRLKRASVA